MIQPKIIDVRGLACPKPLMVLKAQIPCIPVGDCFEVWFDNEIACSNASKVLEQMACVITEERRDGILVLKAVKTSTSEKSQAIVLNDKCELKASSEDADSDYVIVIAQDTMGQGDSELGSILLYGAISALLEVSPQPTTMVFYNSGVKLACEGSRVIDVLKALQERKVKMLVCGTCLSFFELKDDLRVGQISNMYEILETVARSKRVFRP